MNKTITANIGGRVFNIEEHAYDLLNNYLSAIRGAFKGTASADEIISDIELRIAELFMERTSSQKQVITPADIDEVITIMGQPEDYVDGDEDRVNDGGSFGKSHKQVFRDPDNKVVFGVCGGIAAYFGIDPIVIRIIFIAFTIFYGTGIIIYIVLGIIIPKASTTAEKLRMRGEPVTVDNISRKVTESLESLKDFGKKKSGEQTVSRNIVGEISAFFAQIFDFLGDILKIIGLVLTKVLGVLFTAIGAIGIFFTIVIIVGWESYITLAEQNFQDNGIFYDSDWQNFIQILQNAHEVRLYLIIGFALTAIVPALIFLLVGIRLLFNIRFSPIVTTILFITLWLVGVGLLITGWLKLMDSYKVKIAFEEKLLIDIPQSNTLYLDVMDADETSFVIGYGFMDGHLYSQGSVTFPGIDSTNIHHLGRSQLWIEENGSDSLIYLITEYEARGATQKKAMENAKNIKSNMSISGDTLRLNTIYAVLDQHKSVGESMHFRLRLPVGRTIQPSEAIRSRIKGLPKGVHFHENDGLPKTWLMTIEGLVCSSCADSPAQSAPLQADSSSTLPTDLKP